LNGESIRLVCETAGYLQGMFPGDLGDIGTASLNEDKVLQLAQMLLSDGSLELFSDFSDSVNKKKKSSRDSSAERRRKNISNERRRRIGMGGGDPISKLNPLSKRERRYLELCARILRCTQRYFLMKVERNELKCLTEDLIVVCFKNNGDGNESEGDSYDGLSSDNCVASIEQLSICPWVVFLMKGLCSHTSIRYKERSLIQSLGDIPKMAATQKSDIPAIERKSMIRKSKNHHPSNYGVDELQMKKAVNNSLSKSSSKSLSHDQVHVQVKVYLQIICACAEVFPRGECWSSTNKWYRTNYSPLDSNAELSMEEGGVSYCNACSPSDIAALIHSVTDILCHYGTTGGDLSVQMWGLVCLMKLTESTNIATRYWKKENSSIVSNEVPLAWRRVWDMIFRYDLRYLSYTSSALTGSHGELVLILLTEIIKGSLTSQKYELDSEQSHTTPFLRKHQDKVWNLPVFKSAARIQISAPFELISMLVNRAGLVEGEKDAFAESEFDDTMSERLQKEKLEGTGRRYRITCFCVSFIRIGAMRNDSSLLRKILPFVTTCFAVLTGNKKMFTPITTFSIQSMRTLRAAESRHCLNEDKCIYENNSKFCTIWADSIEPFSFQYSTENNPYLWDDLNGRDKRLCPPWSMEDRSWLKHDLLFKNQSFDRMSSGKALDLQSFGLNIILRTVGFGAGERSTKDFDISLSCRVAVTKCVLAVSLLNDYEISDNGIHWRFIEEMFDSILKILVADMKYLATDKELFSNILSDFVGILRLFHACEEICPNQVRGLRSSKHFQGLNKECNRILKDYTKTKSNVKESKNEFSPENNESEIDSEDDDDASHFLTPARTKNSVSTLSPQSESEIDAFDESDEDSVRGRKRMGKQLQMDGRSAKKRRMTENNASQTNSSSSTIIDDEMELMDAKGSWLCAYILVLLKPSNQTCSDIIEALVYDTYDPHDSILCLGLFHTFVPLSLIESSSVRDDKLSIFSLCADVIGEGKRVAEPSSPYHMIGFSSCQVLMGSRVKKFNDLERMEIEDVIKMLRPEIDKDKKALRAILTRPIIRLLRLQAAIKCFTVGNEDFHKKFDPIYENSFVIDSLRDQNSRIRRLGAKAVGAALKYFPLKVQQNIVDDAFKVLPPLDCNPVVTNSRITLESWIDSRVSRSNNGMIDFERKAWVESTIALQADVLYCINIISGETKSEEIRLQMLTCIFETPSESYKIQASLFNCIENISLSHNFDSLEDLIRIDEFDFIQNWINFDKPLLSLPMILCCPSIMRCIMRIGCQDTVDFGILQEHVADEYAAQKASIIIPCILIDQPIVDDEVSDDKIASKRDRYIEEVADICVDGNISKLLRSHIHDIYAFAMPMIQYEVDGGFPLRKRAKDILSFLQTFPKLGHRHVVRSTHLIVTQILHLYGREVYFDEDLPITKSSCMQALKYFSEKVIGKKLNLKAGLFQNSGTSTTECLLYARRLLDNSSYSFEKRQTWRMVDLIMDEVHHHACVEGSENSQLGFCISSLLSMSLDKRHKDLRYKILVKIKEVLEGVTKYANIARQNREEIYWILNKLVGTMIQIHEECQDDVISFCLDSWQHQRTKNLTNGNLEEDVASNIDMDTAVGKNRDIPTDDTLKLAVEIHGVNLNEDTASCANLAFEILEIILDKKSKILQEQDLLSIDPFPEPNIPKNHLEMLVSLNPKYNLSNLLRSFEDSLHSISGSNILTDAKRFESIAKRYMSNKSRTTKRQDNGDINGLEARTLISGIERVKKILPLELNELARSQKGSQVPKVVSTIVQYLFNFCDHQYPCGIQVAAGSCLGSLVSALNNTDVEMNQISSIHSGNRTYFQSDLLEHFFTEIFNLIANYVQSDDTETAIIAKDTLKTLLLTKDGLSCWKKMESEHELRRIVLPFLTSEKARYDVEDVPPVFLKHLMELTNLTESDLEKDKSWCWCDEIWKCNVGSDIQYEDWIKNVVSAMLLCCYRRDTNEQNPILSMIQGSSDFFRPCVKLCASKFFV
jgi:hypothetical protein